MKLMKLTLCSLFIFSSAFANELKIKSGLWESTMTMSNSMTTPVTKTEKNCVQDKSFKPEDFMKELQDCKLTKNELANNTLSFAMQCNMQGVKTLVVGEYFNSGDTGKGKMDFDMDMNGMAMKMSMKWDAKRIGDCKK